MEKFPNNNNFLQEEGGDTRKKIEEAYAKEGKLEEYQITKRLQELEREKIRLEHELTIARQNKERQQRITEYDVKQGRGENMSFGVSVLNAIDKDLESELNKTQEDYDNE